MPKISKFVLHEYWLIGVLLLLTGLRILTKQWIFSVEILWWWLGAIFGFLFVFTDRLIYAFWQQPDDVLSMKLKELFTKGKFFKGLALALQERNEQKNVVIRSLLFLGIWVALAFLTLTSTRELLGRGFMLGLGLHLTFDLVADYWGKGRDIRLWFWQIKKEFTHTEIATVVWGYVILFVLIAWGL
jgi:hypothetical protein